MSSDDRIELRDMPAVEPVAWPDRLSQTLAQWHDKCPRAAYLYVKTGGGAPTHPMDGGSLYHACAQQLMADLILHGEATHATDDESLSTWTATIVDEVARKRPDLVVSHERMDVVRACLYHTALGLDVDPKTVAGIEQKFLLELPESGWTVSGIIDLATMPDDDSGEVNDYKTQLHVPSRTDWDSFQCKLYATALVFGRPVTREPCACGASEDDCPACKGRGTVEVLGEPMGGHLARVRGRELYPRRIYGGRDGEPYRLPANERVDKNGNSLPWTRLELHEFLLDLDRAGVMLNDRLRTWKFPARADPAWCGRCPAENECPIPRKYRRFAGRIQTLEQAEEAWSWVQRIGERVKQTTAEVKGFSAQHDVEIRVGDHVWAFEATETRKLRTAGGRSDWDGLQARVTEAVTNGELVDLPAEGWITTSSGSGFKKRKAPADKGRVESNGGGAE